MLVTSASSVTHYVIRYHHHMSSPALAETGCGCIKVGGARILCAQKSPPPPFFPDLPLSTGLELHHYSYTYLSQHQTFLKAPGFINLIIFPGQFFLGVGELHPCREDNRGRMDLTLAPQQFNTPNLPQKFCMTLVPAAILLPCTN